MRDFYLSLEVWIAAICSNSPCPHLVNLFPRVSPLRDDCQNSSTPRWVHSWHMLELAFAPPSPKKLHIHVTYQHRHQLSLQIRNARGEKAIRRRQDALGQPQVTVIKLSSLLVLLALKGNPPTAALCGGHHRGDCASLVPQGHQH